MKSKKFRVFYGFTKLNKVMTKRELAIFFENADNNPEKAFEYVKRNMDIVCTRYQAPEETEQSVHFKMFTKYSYLIDSKKWSGDIDKILDHNFKADANHVEESERSLIKKELLEYYLKNYKN